MNKKLFPIAKRPHYGGKVIAIKQRIHVCGTYHVDLETGDIDATELHSNLTYKNTGRYVICAYWRNRR